MSDPLPPESVEPRECSLAGRREKTKKPGLESRKRMKLTDKYLLKEYLLPVAYCLAAFSMIFVVYDLFDHLSSFIESRASVLMVAKYYLCMLTPTLEYLAPASLLLATLYTLWQFSRHNELVAMRASGVSLYRIMLPFVAVGFAFSLSSAVLKETVSPKANEWAKRYSQNKFHPPSSLVFQDRAYYSSLARRQWLIGKMRLHDGATLKDVKITQERPDGSRELEITTEKAKWLDDQWWFVAPKVQKYDQQDAPVGRPTLILPDPDMSVEMTSLNESPSDLLAEFRDWEDLSSIQMWRYLKKHPELSERATANKTFDLYHRLAMPWACLVVTLFGVPAGAKSRRHSALTGIFGAMGLFLGFYALMQIGTFMGKRQLIEPWLGAWLSNIVFLGAGMVMTYRMNKGD